MELTGDSGLKFHSGILLTEIVQIQVFIQKHVEARMITTVSEALKATDEAGPAVHPLPWQVNLNAFSQSGPFSLNFSCTFEGEGWREQAGNVGQPLNMQNSATMKTGAPVVYIDVTYRRGKFCFVFSFKGPNFQWMHINDN